MFLALWNLVEQGNLRTGTEALLAKRNVWLGQSMGVKAITYSNI